MTNKIEKDEKLQIDSFDYSGKRTVFTEKQWTIKMEKHPELREENFSERIKEAIQKPNFIYIDLSKKERHAYYFREYKMNSRIKYTKVIVRQGEKINFIITAFRPDYVKERDKTSLVYGIDEKE